LGKLQDKRKTPVCRLRNRKIQKLFYLLFFSQ
jgi:hypothetical protein